MLQYRVTKYDPAKRDPDGAFRDAGEWTDASEVGTVCGGVVLTLDAYRDAENRYVRAVESFVNEAGIGHLRCAGVEGPHETEPAVPGLTFDAEQRAALRVGEDAVIGSTSLALFVCAVLRNELWCKLELADRFFVHFGWDYYMYIGTAVPCPEAVARACADGLFVEPFESPYHRQAHETCVAKITVFAKDDQTEPQAYDHPLPSATVAALRTCLGYSSEHPLFGHFEITREAATQLKHLTDLQFDFARFDYYLDTSGG